MDLTLTIVLIYLFLILRKKIFLILVLVPLFSQFLSKDVLSNTYTDKFSKCLVDSTSRKDSIKLMKWVMRLYAAHPDITKFPSFPDNEANKIDKEFAKLFTRYLEKDCKKEVNKALKKEERDVFFNAFRTLYESAGLSFSENEDVIKASENFIKYMKPETLELISY